MRIAISLFPYLKTSCLANLLDVENCPYHQILAVVEDAYITFIAGVMCNDTRVIGNGFVIYPELDPWRSLDRLNDLGVVTLPRHIIHSLEQMCGQKELLVHLQELPLSMGGEYRVTSAASVPTGVLVISDGIQS